MGMSKDSVHLEADVHATKDETHGFAEDAWIPYLDIHFELTKDGDKAYKKTGILFPMTAKDGPHYANNVDMAGPGTYHLTYIISPPHQPWLHPPCRQGVGRAGLVEADHRSWTFTYPSKNQMRTHSFPSCCALLVADARPLADAPIPVTLAEPQIHARRNSCEGQHARRDRAHQQGCARRRNSTPPP